MSNEPITPRWPIDLLVDDHVVALKVPHGLELVNALVSKVLGITVRLDEAALTPERRHVFERRRQYLEDLLFAIEHGHLPPAGYRHPRRMRPEGRPWMQPQESHNPSVDDGAEERAEP